MLQRLLRLASAPALLAAFYWFLAAPGWGFVRLLALLLFAGSALILLGRLGGAFAVVALLAMQFSDLGDDANLLDALLAIFSALFFGCVLACLVLRHPSLGKRIEHGPLGPGI